MNIKIVLQNIGYNQSHYQRVSIFKIQKLKQMCKIRSKKLTNIAENFVAWQSSNNRFK